MNQKDVGASPTGIIGDQMEAKIPASRLVNTVMDTLLLCGSAWVATQVEGDPCVMMTFASIGLAFRILTSIMVSVFGD
jgi:hypothetical protein